ncbi:MAG TPA: hypothetical protein VMQ48_00580 [Candidatus Saccharimonadales bacterium]|nr:hypothetical protein [Candidatus Saccharimonadales bacterium]
MGDYNVAFRYTRKAGAYHGVVNWTSFSSREEFQQMYTPERQEHQEVVEEGITEERAIQLTFQTPLSCRLAASIGEATDEAGNINPTLLEVLLANSIYAEREARKRGC